MLKKQKCDLLKEINSFRVEIGFFHENSVIFVHLQSPNIFFNFKLLRKIDFLQKSFLSLTNDATRGVTFLPDNFHIQQ